MLISSQRPVLVDLVVYLLRTGAMFEHRLETTSTHYASSQGELGSCYDSLVSSGPKTHLRSRHELANRSCEASPETFVAQITLPVSDIQGFRA